MPNAVEAPEKLTKTPGYARQAGGRFAKGSGNPGKPVGAISFANRAIGEVARELFERFAPAHFEELFRSKRPTVAEMRVRQQALESLRDIGWGRAPQVVKIEDEFALGTPMRTFLDMAKQPIPARPDRHGERSEKGE